MHLTAQLLPLLKLVDVGAIAIQATELSSLALYPAGFLQLLAPLALCGEAVEVAPETSRRIVREAGELVEPVASGTSCVASQLLVSGTFIARLTS